MCDFEQWEMILVCTRTLLVRCFASLRAIGIEIHQPRAGAAAQRREQLVFQQHFEAQQVTLYQGDFLKLPGASAHVHIA